MIFSVSSSMCDLLVRNLILLFEEYENIFFKSPLNLNEFKPSEKYWVFCTGTCITPNVGSFLIIKAMFTVNSPFL